MISISFKCGSLPNGEGLSRSRRNDLGRIHRTQWYGYLLHCPVEIFELILVSNVFRINGRKLLKRPLPGSLSDLYLRVLYRRRVHR